MRRINAGERPDETCTQMAARQHGVISYDQALSLGMSPDAIGRRARSGAWERVLPRTFRMPGATATQKQRFMAVTLWAGRTGAISHLSAAALLGLCEQSPSPVEVSLSSNRRTPVAWLLIHRVRSIAPRDTVVVDGIVVTNAARTLLDIASKMPKDELEIVLDRALSTRQTTLPRLRWILRMEGARGRPGTRLLRQVVDNYSGRASESVLETLFLQVIRAGGLPSPVKQHAVRDGTFAARVDFAYPGKKIAIELDGYRFHGGRSAWVNDMRRANELVARGWRILRFGWDDVTRAPRVVCDKVAAALDA